MKRQDFIKLEFHFDIADNVFLPLNRRPLPPIFLRRFVSPSAVPPTGVFAVVKSVAAESWIIVDPISEVVKTWIPDARHRCNVRHRRYLNILYPAMSAR